MPRLLITPLLAILALAGAAAVAFGTHPDLAQYPAGMAWITLARRLQWPTVFVCLVLCGAIVALVVTGKRRTPWLVVLAPVLVLFYQRFTGDEFRRMAILDNPPFVAAEQAGFLTPESAVVGLVFEDQPYAYPCGALLRAPVVAHADADKRLLLMYSPYAGRAQAFVVDNTVKAREIDIVSMPAGAMLLFNSRIGQFVNAFTGATLEGDRPEGFHTPLETRRATWGDWRALHPDTRVLAIAAGAEMSERRFPPRPVELTLPAEARVALLATPRPLAVQPDKFSVGPQPLNLSAGGANLLVFREKGTGTLRVFDRAVKGDLFPRFTRKSVPKKPEVAFVDSDTASLWDAQGHCVDGYAKGERLRPIRLEEDLPYGTLKSFYPDLELLTVK